MRYKPLTDAELKKVLKHLVILTDSAEQENSHIIEYFEKKKIAFNQFSLSEGDYSGMITCNEETAKILGITKDLYFTNDILIERKAHIDELCGNLKNTGTKERQRFEFELTRIALSGADKFLLIEDKDGEENIRTRNYRSEYEPAALYNSLKAFEARYKCPIVFNSKEISPMWIFSTIKMHVREKLKQGEYIQEESVVNE
ncbi:MAG: ERCC4 domain-containing protein [Clostridium sp.]